MFADLSPDLVRGAYYVEGARADVPAVTLKVAGLVQTMAALYDMRHHPNTKDTMTFKSPFSGNPVGR